MMPIFDYICHTCGAEVEKIVKSNQIEMMCDNCENIMMRKVSAPAAIQFKGSGFYETDYKSKEK